MSNPIRDYAWGSTSLMAEFLGTEPSGRPEAELWMGAHDGAPSVLPDGRKLNEAVQNDPQEFLGPRVRDIFGDRLPFLMKVLAINEPLSLQVHPSSVRARMGFAEESAAGIALDAPNRNYKDQSSKPEMVFALTRFEGMAGFRDVAQSAELLHMLNLPWSEKLAVRLECGPARQVLGEAVTDILAMKGRTLKRLLKEVHIACLHAEARSRRTTRTKSVSGASSFHVEAANAFGRAALLAEKYPADPGVLVTLLLNHIVLAPGEAMFLDAGVIHAYASGVGLEIMSSSDNVLRAGLTPKHMDVDELLRVTNFTPIPPPRWEPTERTKSFLRIDPPVAEFCLTVARPPVRRYPESGPRILIALDGVMTVRTATESQDVLQGQSVMITDADGPIEVAGTGRFAIGAVPR